MPPLNQRFTASGDRLGYGTTDTLAGPRLTLLASFSRDGSIWPARLEDEEAVEVATFLLREVAKRMPESKRLAVETFLDTLAGVTQPT